MYSQGGREPALICRLTEPWFWLMKLIEETSPQRMCMCADQSSFPGGFKSILGFQRGKNYSRVWVNDSIKNSTGCNLMWHLQSFIALPVSERYPFSHFCLYQKKRLNASADFGSIIQHRIHAFVDGNCNLSEQEGWTQIDRRGLGFN